MVISHFFSLLLVLTAAVTGVLLPSSVESFVAKTFKRKSFSVL